MKRQKQKLGKKVLGLFKCYAYGARGGDCLVCVLCGEKRVCVGVCGWVWGCGCVCVCVGCVCACVTVCMCVLCISIPGTGPGLPAVSLSDCPARGQHIPLCALIHTPTPPHPHRHTHTQTWGGGREKVREGIITGDTMQQRDKHRTNAVSEQSATMCMRRKVSSNKGKWSKS